MKNIVKDSVILCAITLAAGLLLGGVYEITKEPRAKQEEQAKQTAYRQVFQEADSFEDTGESMEDISDYLVEHGMPQSKAYIQGVVRAMDGNNSQLGYVVTVTDKEGYGGDITFTLGVKTDGTIQGISFLTLTETAGVGMRADKEEFKSQFKGKKVDAFTYVKDGADEEHEIDAMGGATVTTNAVTNGVNAGILCVNYMNSLVTGKDTGSEGGEAHE